MRLPFPTGHAKKIQPDRRMLVGEHTREPRPRRLYIDAELLVKLPGERALRQLTGLDLAAGKFPPARIHFSRGPLCEQEGTVGAQDHCRGDFDDHVTFSTWRRRTWSRADRTSLARTGRRCGR